MRTSLRFERILIVSNVQKAARDLSFHGKTTILLGANQAGKSSVAKSLFWAFGCEPRFHPRWTAVRPLALVEFTVCQRRYTVLRYTTPGRPDTYGLFDAEGRLLLQARKVTGDWSAMLAEILRFDFVLASRDGVVTQPPPAFMLLPFYIDQDRGWSRPWNSFERLGQYSGWEEPLAGYFAGKQQPAFYRRQAEKVTVQQQVARSEAEHDTLRRVRVDLNDVFPTRNVPALVTEEFTKAMGSWVERRSGAARELEELRKNVSALEVEIASLEEQLHLMEAAKRELVGDFAKAGKLPLVVECPLCGHEHENNVAEKFRVVRDAAQCEEVLVGLRQDISVAREKRSWLERRVRVAVRDLDELDEAAQEQRAASVDSIEDVIDQASRSKLDRVLEGRDHDMAQRAGKLRADLRQVVSQLRELKDARRDKAVMMYYREMMGKYLSDLEAKTAVSTKKLRIVGPGPGTGSEGARSLLAYYFALRATSLEHSSAPLGPMVVDSPNQQAQDQQRLARVMQFIAEADIGDGQMILGVEKLQAVPDHAQIHRLTERWELLDTNAFPRAWEEVEPLLAQFGAEP